MTRVMIIGNAGGGKSTLSRIVAAVHGLPLSSIDQIQWQPGWVQTPEAEYARRHADLLAQERWLIDGYGNWGSVLQRMAAADTIIIVDLPLWVHLWWASKRQIKSFFIGRSDGPEGCPMLPMTFRLIQMMLWLHREMRPKLLAAAEESRGHARVIRLETRPEWAAFAANPV